MTLMPFTVVNDSIVARADPVTVTEWMPKTLVNQVATFRDALTVTESLALRLVVDDTPTLSLPTPFFAYWARGGATGRSLPGRDLTGPGQRRGVSGTLHLVLVQRPEAVVDRKPGHAQQAHQEHHEQDQRLTGLPAVARVVGTRMRES